MSTNEIKGKVYSPLAIDKTLTQEYMCADAKATGDAINNLGKIVSGVYDVATQIEMEAKIDELYSTMSDNTQKVVQINLAQSGTNLLASSYFVTISRGYEKYGHVTLISETYGRLFRKYFNGLWDAWEWECPPLWLGTEYRTIEKYNSKPVYVKLIDCGGMPSASATKNQAHGISNMKYIVDFGGGMAQDGAGAISLPFYFSNENQAHLSVTNESIVIVSGSNNLTNYNDVLVWVKYTKSTD